MKYGSQGEETYGGKEEDEVNDGAHGGDHACLYGHCVQKRALARRSEVAYGKHTSDKLVQDIVCAGEASLVIPLFAVSARTRKADKQKTAHQVPDERDGDDRICDGGER